MKIITWLFWKAYYIFGYPRNLHGYILAGERCRSPWWKFKPCIHYNIDGKQWEVYLKDVPYYVTSETIKLNIHRAQESDYIVGFTIYDSSLTNYSGR